MSVSASSAKVKFFVGDFNLTTGISDFPESNQSNTLSLEIDSIISSQLTGWGDTPREIYCLFSVEFEGQNIYKNVGFDDPDTPFPPPSDPDITITPDANPATTESIVLNNFIPLVFGTDGVLSSGEYVVSVKFVYWGFDSSYVSQTTDFSANFSFIEKKPVISNPYNPGTPKLTITDGQTYQIDGVLAERETEFVLFPPEENSPITNTFSDIQSVTYNSFFVGDNSVRYTTLLEYDLTDKVIVNAQQVSKPFIIYYVDNCTIYSCLNSQYDVWKSSDCGASAKESAFSSLIEATSIAYQITEGLGCNDVDLSGLIEDFNKVLNCNCSCLDTSPRQVGASSVVLATDRQSVTTQGSTLTIDLSLGSTVSVNVLENVTISIINIEQFNNYRFIFKTTSTDKTVALSLTNFKDSTGSLLPKTVTANEILITDFYSELQTELTLTSSND